MESIVGFNFSLSTHVQNGCKSCFVQLHDFRHVSRFLTHDASVLVLLLVVSWIIATHFSGASPNLNNTASKIVQPELFQTSVDTPVSFFLNNTHLLKHLRTSFFTMISPIILLHSFLPAAVLIVLCHSKVLPLYS